MSEPAWVPLGASGYVPQGALVTALPGSPVDGQEVVLTDSLTAPTFTWRFRYVAAKATNRWVFIGGAPILAEVTTLQTRVLATYGDLATVGPSIAIPVAGDYSVTIGCEISVVQNVAQPCYMSYDIGATAAVDADAISHSTEGGPSRWKSNMRTRRKSLGAVTLTAKYRGDGTNTFNFQARLMSVQPIAVGG